MKYFIAAILVCSVVSSNAQLNVKLLSQVTYQASGNDVWGYVAPNGDEYAIMGLSSGVSVVNVTDPRNPIEVAFIDQVRSPWRDMKTWGEYVYVTSESSGNGLLAIDMRQLPDTLAYENLFLEVPGVDTVRSCHNIYIDEGFAYLAGCNPGVGGVEIFDVASEPGNPLYVASINQQYSHDVYVRDNRVYSSEINIGQFSIYDVTDKSNITFLAGQTTPFAFTHNTWLSDDGNTLFTTDERPNAPVGAYDVSDPQNIMLLDDFRPAATAGEGGAPHNVHVWSDWLIVSYYSDGCVIVDAARPDNLIEVGNFDTFLGASGLNGAWGAYPFFPSGTILIGDISNGLFILGPEYKRASYLEGLVTDAETGESINGASITIDSLSLTDFTEADGLYKTGTIEEGEYLMTVSRAGYITQERTITLSNGVLTEEDFQLENLGSFNLRGTVADAETGEPIPNAGLRLMVQGEFIPVVVNSEGNFGLDQLILGDYDIIAGSWGYEYSFLEAVNFSEEDVEIFLDIELTPGYEDVFSLDLGWEVSNTAFQGDWFRAVPIGTSPPGFGIEAAPSLDSPDLGDRAYITGQSPDFVAGLLFGVTALTSPSFDATDMETPAMTYDYWQFGVDQNVELTDNPVVVSIDNGIVVVAVDSVVIDDLNFEWRQSREIILEDYIELTSDMRVIVTMDNQNQNAAVEGGFDNWRLYDKGIVAVTEINEVDFRVHPNPSYQNFVVRLPETYRNGEASLVLRDTQGRLLGKQQVPAEAQTMEVGEYLDSGIYFLQLVTGNSQSQWIKIVKTDR